MGFFNENNLTNGANSAINIYRDIKANKGKSSGNDSYSNSGLGIEMGGDGRVMTHFRRFGVADENDYDPHLSGYSYIFVTTPSINTNSRGFPGTKYREIYGSALPSLLDSSVCHNRFIRPLTNLHSNISENDWGGDPVKGWENFRGRGVDYGKGHSYDVSVDFTVDYHETQELFISNLHRIWMDCQSAYANGKMSRREKVYFADNRIDYTSSIYVFNTLADGVTIKYWSKYTGVFPTSLNYSGLGVGKRGSIDVVDTTSIGYHATCRETMSYAILQDFAEITGPNSGNIMDGVGKTPPEFINARPISSKADGGLSDVYSARGLVDHFVGDSNNGGGTLYKAGSEFESTNHVGIKFLENGKIQLDFGQAERK